MAGSCDQKTFEKFYSNAVFKNILRTSYIRTWVFYTNRFQNKRGHRKNVYQKLKTKM